MSNFLHRLGDALEVAKARISFAFRVLTGRYPLPTAQQEANMAAIDDLNAAVSNVKTYVSSLQGELAATDLTPQIVAATEALNAIVPAPVEPALIPDALVDLNPTTDQSVS